jgi:putative ABC transport system permease protein
MLRSTFKLALKVLLRRRFFTAISLFCIVFTLSVLLVVAGLLDHLLAPAAPEVHTDRMLRCEHMVLSGESNRMSGSPGYLFLDRHVRPLPGAESVTLFTEPAEVATFVDQRKIVSRMRHTDGEYWRTLRFTFLEGGPFTYEDDEHGRAVAVINAATRARLFGDDATAVGRDVEFDGAMYRVIGVVANVSQSRRTAFADVWAPIGSLRSEDYRNEMMGSFQAIVLAPNKAAIPALKAAFTAILPRVELPEPERYNHIEGTLRTPFECVTVNAVPGPSDPSNARIREFVLGVGLFALLFMSLPAMNLVNINISRILERSAEIGVRKAFGASSRHLAGQLVFENVVLCVIGGVLALAIAWVALRAIEQAQLIPYAQFALNWRLFAIALGLAVFFGVLSGVYPAWRMSRLHPVTALRGGVR